MINAKILSRSISENATLENTDRYLRDGFEPVSNLYTSTDGEGVLSQSIRVRSGGRRNDYLDIRRSVTPLDAHLAGLVHESMYKCHTKDRKTSPERVRRVSISAADMDVSATRHRSVPEHGRMKRQDSGLSCNSNSSAYQNSQRHNLECTRHSPETDELLALVSTASVGRGKTSSRSQLQSQTQKMYKDTHTSAQVERKKWSLRLPTSWVSTKKVAGPTEYVEGGSSSLRSLHITKDKGKKYMSAPNSSSRSDIKKQLSAPNSSSRSDIKRGKAMNEHMDSLSDAQHRSRSVPPHPIRINRTASNIPTNACLKPEPRRTHVRRHSDPKRPNSTFLASIRKVNTSLGLAKNRNGRSISTPENFVPEVKCAGSYTGMKWNGKDVKRDKKNGFLKSSQKHSKETGGLPRTSNRHSGLFNGRSRAHFIGLSENEIYEGGIGASSESAELVIKPHSSVPAIPSSNSHSTTLGLVRSTTERELLAFDAGDSYQVSEEPSYMHLYESLAMRRSRERSDHDVQSTEDNEYSTHAALFEEYTKGMIDRILDANSEGEAVRSYRGVNTLSEGAIHGTSTRPPSRTSNATISGQLRHQDSFGTNASSLSSCSESSFGYHERTKSTSSIDAPCGTPSPGLMVGKPCNHALEYTLSECDCHLTAEVGQSVHACTEIRGCLEVCTDMTVHIEPQASVDDTLLTQEHCHPNIPQGQAWSGVHTKRGHHAYESHERTAMCILCGQVMKKRGEALYVAACGHTYHWGCANELQLSTETKIGTPLPCYVCTSFPFAFNTYAVLDLSEDEAVEYLRKDGRDGSFLLRTAYSPEKSYHQVISCVQQDVVKHLQVHTTESGSFALADMRDFLTIDEIVFDLYRNAFAVHEGGVAAYWQLKQPCRRSNIDV
ncbi:hypothetical protein SARC_05986 [Sphaeroforma arctica JP610]|uniref:RING-type domain-containing protein n=1 Tax=Sphaeroforma arctica JP610 TaxID=667725 RepID=A0A0L0FYR3_9EUKA|nr:hypothetical protein SARC_05986 [Sphaeroforma arctica JP610]KNC81696.1 hypothetical protein SARC_05986 [Sphaeroforma arctica JP610]|eukprot:XP_014155598.1 hypothetical protein SARC_05986 [Sphaeroforma arctica JP610]